VSTFVVSKGDTILGNDTFADLLAHWMGWRSNMNDDDIIGFQGYRKHLDFRIPRVIKGDWVDLDRAEFRQYQIWQQDCAEPNIRQLLADCDILTNPPYDVTHNGGIVNDFCISASQTDWEAMVRVLRRHDIKEFDIPTVTSYCVFTGTGKIFHEWMTFWWDVVCELTAMLPITCPDPGSRPDIYLPRRMAFLSERIYSLWLHNRRLRTKALPLLVCWELQ